MEAERSFQETRKSWNCRAVILHGKSCTQLSFYLILSFYEDIWHENSFQDLREPRSPSCLALKLSVSVRSPPHWPLKTCLEKEGSRDANHFLYDMPALKLSAKTRITATPVSWPDEEARSAIGCTGKQLPGKRRICVNYAHAWKKKHWNWTFQDAKTRKS